MKANDWLKTSTDFLTSADIGTARLDCLVLLEDATGKDRGWLLAHPETPLQGPVLRKLKRQVKRRVKHEPLAYVRGKTEFYGREFMINKDVLEPRPESETMIELLKQLVNSEQVTGYSNLTIVDIGTGSGALAITAKLEVPLAEVIAIDIDPACLKVARCNAKIHQTNIKFYISDLLKSVTSNLQPVTYVLANLPYVPDDYQLNSAAMNEPKIAIFGGTDGLDLYRQLFKQIDSLAAKPVYILTESLPPQHKKLAAIAKKHSYKLTRTSDFIQVFTNT